MIDRRIVGRGSSGRRRSETASWISSASSGSVVQRSGVAEPSSVQIGADRRVAAGDVEADAHDRDLLAIGGDAADRHHVAEVAVGHQRRALGAARDVGQLGQGVRLVLAEDGDVRGAHKDLLILNIDADDVATLGRNRDADAAELVHDVAL